MDLKDCIEFAQGNPVSYVATTDGDQPRVRAFRIWFADENGFYYIGSAEGHEYPDLQVGDEVNPRTFLSARLNR